MEPFNPVSLVLAAGFIVFGAIAIIKRRSLAESMAKSLPFGDVKAWGLYMWFVAAFSFILAATVLIFSRAFFG